MISHLSTWRTQKAGPLFDLLLIDTLFSFSAACIHIRRTIHEMSQLMAPVAQLDLLKANVYRATIQDLLNICIVSVRL